jgi:hypothetical protein
MLSPKILLTAAVAAMVLPSGAGCAGQSAAPERPGPRASIASCEPTKAISKGAKKKTCTKTEVRAAPPRAARSLATACAPLKSLSSTGLGLRSMTEPAS